MPIASAEQSQIVRRKRRWVRIIGPGAILLIAAVSIVAPEYIESRIVAAAAIMGLGALITGLFIFFVTYWKCPQCGEYFMRGQDGSHCTHCDTHFDLRGD